MAAARHLLVKRQICALSARVQQLQEEADTHGTVHAARSLRHALLLGLCDGLDLVCQHLRATSAQQQGDAATLAELRAQERQLLQQLDGCGAVSQLAEEAQDGSPLRTSAPASDPMALFTRHIETALAPGGLQLTTAEELARYLRNATLEVSVNMHMLNNLPPAAREPALAHLATLWDRYLQGIVATVLAGRAAVVEGMSLLNLDTLQPDIDGAVEQDQRTAALVPQLELTAAQLNVIHTGVQLYGTQLARAQQERQLLQAHPPHLGATARCSSSHRAAASDGGVPPTAPHASSTDSGSCSSNGRDMDRVTMAAYQERHAVAQAHLSRLSLLLQKEHLLRLAVVCLFMGALTLEQLSKATIRSWPFFIRPVRLATLIHDLRQQQLDEQARQQEQQTKDCGNVRALAD